VSASGGKRVPLQSGGRRRRKKERTTQKKGGGGEKRKREVKTTSAAEKERRRTGEAETEMGEKGLIVNHRDGRGGGREDPSACRGAKTVVRCLEGDHRLIRRGGLKGK